MPPNSESEASKGILEKVLGTNPIVDVVQKIVAVAGVVGTAWQAFIKDWRGFTVAGAILLLTALWYLGAHWWRRRHRRKIHVPNVPVGPKAYLRGLLPFERGEALLGRKNDLDFVVAIIDREEFRFGFVSGEAGAGKTSFLRAALIPQLDALGWTVCYVPRLGANPADAVRRELRRLLFPDSAAEIAEPIQTVSELTRRLATSSGKRVILVCDQFEQFFLAFPTLESRYPFIEELIQVLRVGEHSPALLLSVRKEFVDDLQDIEAYIPDFVDQRNRHRLRNWESKTAVEILRAAAEHDGVPFSEELIEAIVADLAREGIVRPVELQIVATNLYQQGIFEIRRYVTAGRARGVLVSYVRDFIEPNGGKTPELQRQAARHLLRALCADTFDARRPGGLTAAELGGVVRESIRSSDRASVLTSAEDLAAVIQRLLKSGLDQYLLIMEDEECINLAHDYIVGPIREATANVSSLREQADRILDQHLEYRRLQASVQLSWRQLRFIQTHGSPSHLSTATAATLLSRAKLSAILRASFIGAAILALLWLLLPHGTLIVQTRIDSGGSSWYFSEDKTVALGYNNNNRQGFLWRLDSPWESRVFLPIPFTRIELSPQGKYVVGSTKNGDLYLWPTRAIPTVNFHPTLTGLMHRAGSQGADVEFSNDEQWVVATTRDGKCYLWNPAEPLSHNPTPLVTNATPFPTGPERMTYDKTPFCRFDPAGKWLLIIEGLGYGDYGLGRLYALSDGKQGWGSSPGIIAARGITWSRKGTWLGATSESGEFLVWDLTATTTIAAPKFRLKLSAAADPVHAVFGASFSPNERWIAVRRSFDNLYLLDTHEWRDTPVPALEVKISSDAVPPSSPTFSPDSKFIVAGVSDLGIYVWRCDDKAGSRREPLVRKQGSVWFSPRGSFVAVDDLGKVFIRRATELTSDVSPCTTHASGNFWLVFSRDEEHVVTYGGLDLSFGETDDVLKVATRIPHDIYNIALSNRRADLIAFGQYDATKLRRKFFVLGIPLRTLKWPELGDAEQLSSEVALALQEKSTEQ